MFELLEHKGYWKEMTPRANVKFLKEMLSSHSSSHRSGSASDGGMAGAHPTSKGYNAGALTKLLTAIDGWRAGVDGDDRAPAIFDFMTIVLKSYFTARRSSSGCSGRAFYKVGAFPSDFAQHDTINAHS